MSVHQTRHYFKEKYGYIVDNKEVGPTLSSAYWECGNSLPFLDIVKNLTGKALTGDNWIGALNKDIEELLSEEKKEYDEMIKKCPIGMADDEEIDLNMTVKFVDGDHLIADSSTAKDGLLGACKIFEEFVHSRQDDKA